MRSNRGPGDEWSAESGEPMQAAVAGEAASEHQMVGTTVEVL